MAILLSHTSALEALRRLGAVPKAGAGGGPACDRVDPAPDAADALLAWERAFGRTPELPLHVQVPADARRVRSRGLVTHPARPLPAGSVFEIADGLLCPTSAALCLQMAPRLTRLELLVLMQELMGTYAVRPDVARGMTSRATPLLAPEELGGLMASCPGIRGSEKVSWAMKCAVPGAASPRESKLAVRLSLAPALGGYGLDVLALNGEVAVATMASMSDGTRRPDVLLFNRKLGEEGPLVALEYDGSDHLDGDRHAQDVRRSNELVSAGLCEYVIDKDLYANLSYMDGLVERVRCDLGLPRQRLSRKQREQRESRRQGLFVELEAIDGVKWDGLARERARREERSRQDDAQPTADDVVPIEAYGV